MLKTSRASHQNNIRPHYRKCSLHPDVLWLIIIIKQYKAYVTTSPQRFARMPYEVKTQNVTYSDTYNETAFRSKQWDNFKWTLQQPTNSIVNYSLTPTLSYSVFVSTSTLTTVTQHKTQLAVDFIDDLFRTITESSVNEAECRNPKYRHENGREKLPLFSCSFLIHRLLLNTSICILSFPLTWQSYAHWLY